MPKVAQNVDDSQPWACVDTASACKLQAPIGRYNKADIAPSVDRSFVLATVGSLELSWSRYALNRAFACPGEPIHWALEDAFKSASLTFSLPK